jgi:endonuclease/exonuclease/phosphatase family metal-dependent hydrolase
LPTHDLRVSAHVHPLFTLCGKTGLVEPSRSLIAALVLQVFGGVFATACAAESDASVEDTESDLDKAAEPRQGNDPTGRRICSWNIRRLGHNFDNRPKDMGVTAAIIEDHCDVIAVQEVMQVSGGGTPGFDGLLQKLGAGWQGVRTEQPRPVSTSANSERYAFFWRTDAARLCNDWVGAQYFSDDEDAFLREPAWTCIKLKRVRREILIGSYHAIFGTMIERRREVSFLDDDLNGDQRADDFFSEMRASRPNASMMLLGDFNLTPPEMAEALPRYKVLSAEGPSSTLDDDDSLSPNRYDHLVMRADDRMLPRIPPSEVLDVRKRAQGDTYFRSVSDHLPIRFTIQDAQ